MKEYCVDLEIAKELKENGFPQKGFFWWHCYKSSDFCRYQNSLQYRQNEQIPEDSGLAIDYFAPTSDEILKELPDLLVLKYITLQLEITKQENKYSVSYEDDPLFVDKKLSNSLAKMWLVLKKEGYIK